MRICFLNPPTNYTETNVFLEPLGLAYVASACKTAGHEVMLRDLVNLPYAAKNIETFFADMDRFRPQLVGITAMSENFKNGLELAQAVKQRYGCTVIFGGWHVSGDPASVSHPAIDYVVCGEGEDTLLELLDYLQNGSPALESIAGIGYEKDGKVCINPSRKRILKLSKLPEPFRDSLAKDQYKFPPFLSQPISRMKTLSVQASRGCPYKCTFCQTPALWGALWSRREPVQVVDEIERLVDTENINTLFIRDEEFTIRDKWVLEICSEIVRRGLPKRLTWGSFFRVDDITVELADALAEAGYVWGLAGVEASNPQDSENLKKYYERDEAETALRLFSERKITVHASWIIGFPWDTREKLDQAFEWLKTLDIDLLNICFASPFHGTELRRYVEENDLLRNKDTNYLNVKEPVIVTPHIPYEEIKSLPDHYLRQFYFRPRQVGRLLTYMARSPSRIRSVAEMAYYHVINKRIFSRYNDARSRAQVFEVPDRLRQPLGKKPLAPRAQGASAEPLRVSV